MNQPSDHLRASKQSEIEKLQEEIAKLSTALGLFGQASEQNNPSPEEMIETLNGIGQGSLSCAALLKVMTSKSRSVGRQYKATAPQVDDIAAKRMQGELDAILTDAELIVKECSKLSAALRRMKRNMVKAGQIGPENDEELAQISQQVQSALMSVTLDWESL